MIKRRNISNKFLLYTSFKVNIILKTFNLCYIWILYDFIIRNFMKWKNIKIKKKMLKKKVKNGIKKYQTKENY
jgi:hypothetical protein